MKIHAHEWVLGGLLFGLAWFLFASSSTDVARAEEPAVTAQPAPATPCEHCALAAPELDA